MTEFLHYFIPVQASTFAAKIDTLYLFLILLTVFFTVLIYGLVCLFSIIYRKRPSNLIPTPIHGNKLLEVTWSIIPLIIVMGIFVWSSVLFFHTNSVPADALEIFVVGKQWMWKIQHPEGPREINELHVPVNRKVRLKMTSEDVIHSFYVPAFRIKMDVVPGRYTETWFEAIEPGTYHLFCAEYCGTKHSQMIGSVVVMREEEYAAWLAERLGQDSEGGHQGESLIDTGKRLFTEHRCTSCHRSESFAQGPALENVYGSDVKLSDGKTVKADHNYLRESILKPNAKTVEGYPSLMPSYAGTVSEEEIIALIEYIKSLSSK